MKSKFFSTEWSLRLTILKIGLPLSILYFITTFTNPIIGVGSGSIFIHLFLLLVTPVLLSFVLFGLVFLGLGSDTIEFLQHN